ncbi:MAG TPA: aminotransferase class V-fold PLP-dependent enzyme, partial [Longimicrobium sp.]|nr:aminotransferase class V-fold PLP-dependent enzyme [Longimicrobium sp.]
RAAYEAVEAHETRLFARLHEGLVGLPRVRFYGPPAGAERTPTAAFTVEGTTPDQVARALGQEGVFVWNGDFYASSVCETLGLAECGGLVRAGVAPYSTDDDVERLIGALERLA